MITASAQNDKITLRTNLQLVSFFYFRSKAIEYSEDKPGSSAVCGIVVLLFIFAFFSFAA